MKRASRVHKVLLLSSVCRLDFWLILDCLFDNHMVRDVDIVPAIKTDHSAITLQLRKKEDGKDLAFGTDEHFFDKGYIIH